MQPRGPQQNGHGPAPNGRAPASNGQAAETNGRARRFAARGRVGLAGPVEVAAPPPPPAGPPWWSPGLFWRNVQLTWTGFTRVFALVWEANRGLTIILAALNLLQGLMPAAGVYLSKLLIDEVVRDVTGGLGLQRLSVVILLVAAQFGVTAATTLSSTLSNIAQQLLQERMGNRIQLMLMRKANELDLAHFERPKFYDLIQQVQQDATYRPSMMVQTSFSIVRQLLTFASMLALLLKLEWFIAAAALLAPIPSFISSARYGWQGYQMARRQSPLRRMMAYLINVLTTDTYNKEIKLFTVGDFFVKRYHELFERYYVEQKSLVIRRYLAGAAWSLLSVLASGATFLYVAYRALLGLLSVGDLTLYVQAASQLSSSFSNLLGGLQSMYEHQLYLGTLFELLDMRPAIEPPAHPRPLAERFQQGIEFRNVTYQYEGQDHPALEDVSFTIQPGETVAVVGHNGAGKTTLVKLIARLYDPSSGQVLIDGHDVREYDPVELRSHFGVLFQDYVTYQLTAKENIGVGRVERLTDEAAILAAAGKSGAASIIEDLPDSYETVLGRWFDGGVQLSGGEWQKVALGRAFMREAQILILDEPSAALDARAEYDLFARLRALAAGRTTVFISHRFSTVRQADRILVFEHGRLIEQGTHEDLLALDGRYAELFNLQAASYR